MVRFMSLFLYLFKDIGNPRDFMKSFKKEGWL